MADPAGASSDHPKPESADLEPAQEPNYNYVESTIIKRDDKGEVEKKIVQTINIIRSNKRKPFLGGFKNQETEVLYHNAFSQTDQIRTEHKLHFTREVSSVIMEDANVRA